MNALHAPRTADAPAPRQASAGRLLVIIPAYNEQGRIGAVLAAIRAVTPADILVIDDGSGDATAVEALAAGAHVARLAINLGYGVALQTGFRHALRHGYERVVQLDADGQHDPAHIPALLEALDGADLVVGSRFLALRSYEPPILQRLGMRIFGVLATWLSGRPVTDSTSGFRAMSREVLEFLAHDRYPVDYPDADTLVMVARAGFRLAEVPVRMRPSPEGKLTMHAGIAKPLYYVFKLTLGLALQPFRREKR